MTSLVADAACQKPPARRRLNPANGRLVFRMSPTTLKAFVDFSAVGSDFDRNSLTQASKQLRTECDTKSKCFFNLVTTSALSVLKEHPFATANSTS
ncbi:hypothetical protein ACLKA7_001723 [Drosophila subpalustris]